LKGDAVGVYSSQVVDDTGAKAGHIIYDAYGTIVENTLPEGLTSPPWITPAWPRPARPATASNSR